MIDTLEQADIRDVWDEVKFGLERTKEKSNATWRIEDVYAACLVGKAFLYVGEPGFVIVQPKEDPITGEPELLVWVAFSCEHHSVERFQTAVDNLGKDHGFKKLVMQSSRPGWDKTPGWTAVSVNYERVLP